MTELQTECDHGEPWGRCTRQRRVFSCFLGSPVRAMPPAGYNAMNPMYPATSQLGCQRCSHLPTFSIEQISLLKLDLFRFILLSLVNSENSDHFSPPFGSFWHFLSGLGRPAVMKTILPHEDFEASYRHAKTCCDAFVCSKDITGEWCYGKSGDVKTSLILVMAWNKE